MDRSQLPLKVFCLDCISCTRDLDTLSQGQQIEFICSNNYIKIQARVWAQKKSLWGVGYKKYSCPSTDCSPCCTVAFVCSVLHRSVCRPISLLQYGDETIDDNIKVTEVLQSVKYLSSAVCKFQKYLSCL